jgi:hypothetical protein
MDIRHSTAVVAGGASGLGEAAVRCLLAAGAAALAGPHRFPVRILRRFVVHACENSYLNGDTYRLDGGARLPARDTTGPSNR